MHNPIIVLSTEEPTAEEKHGISEEYEDRGDFPSDIEYIGDDYTNEEAEKFFSENSEWYSVSKDKATLTPITFNEFRPKYAKNLKDAISKFEKEKAVSYLTLPKLTNVAIYGSDEMIWHWFYVDYRFLTLPDLIDRYGGKKLYILGITDSHA